VQRRLGPRGVRITAFMERVLRYPLSFSKAYPHGAAAYAVERLISSRFVPPAPGANTCAREGAKGRRIGARTRSRASRVLIAIACAVPAR
jgi:hypothetical protein